MEWDSEEGNEEAVGSDDCSSDSESSSDNESDTTSELSEAAVQDVVAAKLECIAVIMVYLR